MVSFGSFRGTFCRMRPWLPTLITAWFMAAGFIVQSVSVAEEKSTAAKKRPNVVFMFADDLGRYASVYAKLDGAGTLNDVVRTPNIDRLASRGITFRNAFVNAPSCTPCRTSLCAGQPFWRGNSAAVLQGARWNFDLPAFPLMLQKSGYNLGKAFKVWSPGTPGDAPIGGNKFAFQKRGGRINQFSQNVTKSMREGSNFENAKQEILQEVEGNFSDFLDAQKDDSPFFFWYGPTNVHRMWEKGSGKALWGIDPDQLQGKVPPFLPDVPEIREDLADYLGEVQAFDASIGTLIDVLERRQLLDDTVLIVSGDHGAPGFPNGKCNLYDFGCQVPLIVQPAANIRETIPVGGIVVDDLVSLVDLAPTILDLCKVPADSTMTGRSLVKQIQAGRSGTIDASFDAVTMGRERHVAGAQGNFSHYPQRALRTNDYLYIVNFAHDRWPLGIPKFEDAEGKLLSSEPSLEQLTNNTFVAFGDIDSGPTKAWLVAHRNEPTWRPYYQRAFGRRPAEELYDLRKDRWQVDNVADQAAYAETKLRLRQRLMEQLIHTDDPRVVGGGWYFENPPMSADPQGVQFTIHRPSANEVVQRDEHGVGKVTLQGALPIVEQPAGGNGRPRPANPLWQYRVIDESSKVIVAWTKLELVPNDRYLNETIEVPQGGWYQIELRNELESTVTVRSQRFGVGDIYIVAGQSNSANYGSERTAPTVDQVVAFDGKQWRVAHDPQPGAAGEGGSFIPALGDQLASEFKVPIGFVSIGEGGTSVREWLPRGERYAKQPTTGAHCLEHADGGYESSGELFLRLAERLVYFGPRGLKGILWHQGESDAGQARAGYPIDRQINGAEYRQYAEILITRSREFAGWEVPWYVAKATYHSEADAADEEFRNAQHALCDIPAVYSGADSDQLRGDHRDGVHFNAKGLKAHADLWKQSLVK